MVETDMKVTVVGDGAVGKTCMLIAYITKRFNEDDYVPTIFDNHIHNVFVDGRLYTIDLWDTAGQEDYARLRTLSYPNTTCFILSYAINNRISFDNIWEKWAPELKHNMPHTPIILVGTKADLRMVNNPALNLISEDNGHALAEKIKAACYLECSAKRMKNLDTIITRAVRASTRKDRPKKARNCSVL